MDFYSKLIRTAKYVLIIVACAVLLTVAIWRQRSGDPLPQPEDKQPAPVTDIQNSMSNTVSRGANRKGELFEIRSLKTVFGTGQIASESIKPTGHIDLQNGIRVSFEANHGSFFHYNKSIDLKGGVQVLTSEGTVLTSENVQLLLDQYIGLSPTPVQVRSALGEINSDTMNFSWGSSGLNIHFQGNVALVYRP